MTPIENIPIIESISQNVPELRVRPVRTAKQEALTRIQNPRAFTVSEDLPPPGIILPTETLGYGATKTGPLAVYWDRARNDEIEKQLKLGFSNQPYFHDIKLDALGNVAKLKARLVADGNQQRPGIDYDFTYAPTPSPEIASLLLTIAAARDYEVHQVDVDSAYLHAPMDVPLYMHVPSRMVLGTVTSNTFLFF